MDHAGATRGVYPARCFHPCRRVRGAGAVQSACERVHGAAVLHTTGHAAETVGGASDALHMVKECLACSVLHTTPPRHGATHAGTPIMKQARLGGGLLAVQCSAPFDGASRTSIEAGSVVGASEDGDSRRRMRPAQQGDEAWATNACRVAAGPCSGACSGVGGRCVRRSTDAWGRWVRCGRQRLASRE